jgi:soluble cytochrome b562
MFPKYRHMPEKKKKICVWVSNDMYNDVVNAGYDSPTTAVLKGFELILGEEERRKNVGELEQIAAQLTADVSNLKNENERLNTALTEVPNPMELAQMRNRSEEFEKQIHALEESLRNAPEISEFSRLRARLEELEKHNQTLKGELEEAKRDKEDLKTTYNNYFLQVQTLINQKAIEAPGEKKKWWKFW